MVACDLSGFCSACTGRMPTRYVWNKLRTSRMRHWMSFWCPGGTSLAHAYPIATRHLGKARARLHRLLNDVAFVRLAEPPPTAVACFSLHNVKSRPATVGDKLTTRNFNTGTCGFATPEDSTTAYHRCITTHSNFRMARLFS